MKIDQTQFTGTAPKVSPRLLPPTAAQIARNCDLYAGNIKAVKGLSQVAALPAADRTTVYPYGSGWLSWVADVDVVKSPVSADAYSRIYYTGDGVPKVRGTVGVTQYEWNLGVPAPASAPTLTAQAKSSVSWTRQWHYQYEDANGTVTQTGDLTEGAWPGHDVEQTVAGSTYWLTSLPARTTASASDTLIIYFDALDSGGQSIGRCYPASSYYHNNTTFMVEGAPGEATFGFVGAGWFFQLTFYTSRATDYVLSKAYVYTYVTGWGEEGPPSPAASKNVGPVQDCLVSGMLVAAIAGYNITKKRIYRTCTTDAGTQYQYVTEVTLATATYTDTKTDGDLGEVLPSADLQLTGLRWDPPSASLKGLVVHPGGFLAGFVGNTLYLTEAYYPHAWPTRYGMTVPDTIVALAISENAILIMGQKATYITYGDSPATMSAPSLAIEQSCVSKRSVANFGNAVIWACPDGLVMAAGGSTNIVTDAVYNKEQWTALAPSVMLGAVHDRSFYGFISGGAIILDLSGAQSGIRTTNETAAGVYVNPLTDQMNLIQGANLKAWAGGATNLTVLWRSKKVESSRPWNPMAVAVLADSYPVTLRLRAEDAQVLELALANDQARKIPKLRREKTWEYEVEAAVDVHRIMVSQTIAEV